MKLAIGLLFAAIAAAAPDCGPISLTFVGGNGTAPTLPNPYFDNRNTGCTEWYAQYEADVGLSGYTVAFQSATGVDTPGLFGAYSGNTSNSSPSFGTAATGAATFCSLATCMSSGVTVNTPWIRVLSSGATGAGNLRVVFYGYRTGPSASSGGGGGGGSLDPCSQAITAIPSGLHCNTVHLTQADILALDTTPFTLVPASAGNVIFPLAVRWRLLPGPGPFGYQEPAGAAAYLWWGSNASAFGYIGSCCAGVGGAIFKIAMGQTTDIASYVSGLSVNGDSFNFADPAAYTNQTLAIQTQTTGITFNRGPVLTVAVNAPGSAYVVGDQVSPVTTFTGADDAIFTVSSVNGGGGVTGLTNTFPGMFTVPGTNQPTTPIGNVTSATVTALMGGTGYSNGDTGTISGCGSNTATYTVLTSLAGVVQTVSATGGTSYTTMSGCTTTVTTGAGDGTLQLDVVAATGSGLTVNLTVQPGDGTLTVTTWYTVAVE